MDKYEQEIFQFLTVRENFDAMLKVNSHFAMVKEQLLQNFWNLVAKNLAEYAGIQSDEWLVFNPSKKERGDAKLMLYKKEWKLSEPHPFVGIAWEHLYTNSYYGVWSNIKSSNINSSLLKSALDELRGNMEFKADTNWWPLWLHGTCNFSIDSNIALILPDRVSDIAADYASCLIDVFIKTEAIIDKIINTKS